MELWWWFQIFFIGFSLINHPFWGFPPIFGNTHIIERIGDIKQLYLGGGFKYFLFSSLLGEMIQFDVRIFQMG